MRPATHSFTGGPNNPVPAVMSALAGPHPNHTDPAFEELFRALERDASAILASTSDMLIIQAEGVVGLEATTRSLIGPRTRCVNVVNGVFSQALGTAMRDLGASVDDVVVPFDDVADSDALDRELSARPDTDVVAICHVETPSGTVNPLEGLAAAAHRHGAAVFVDAVASAGADPLEVDAWGLDAVVAAPHKALGATPGLSFVTMNERAWALVEANPSAPRRSVLSLLEWRDSWLRGGHFPFTPSVAEVMAGRAACSSVLDEGIDGWVRRHQVAANATRQGALAMGLALWPRSADIGAGAATALRLPDGVSGAAVVEHARSRYDVLMAGSYVAPNVVRIGHMGTASRSIGVVLALGALGRTLLDMGESVKVGDGLEAALEIFAANGPVE